MLAPDERILRLLARKKAASSADVAEALGVSRQAAHRRLQKLARAGAVLHQGAGRTAHWTLPEARTLAFDFDARGLAEDRVWSELYRTIPSLASLAPAALSIVRYAFTEMLNNAIEHSGSRRIHVELELEDDAVTFTIVDRGIGAFANIQRVRKLASPFEALEDLTKGKVTTMPDRHTGEGVFFTSKAVDRFELAANGIRWTVDNRRGDFTVDEVGKAPGTRVLCRVAKRPIRPLADVFGEYTVDFAFAKTRTVVRLYERGVDFVSRSEARRLVQGLEQFREVVVDFDRVASVGQGFADEVFRVFARAHPETRLTPVNMGKAVSFMVRRALAHAGEAP
jgi:anti-sigma regulatory factor (Ser/Thr protein kinase)